MQAPPAHPRHEQHRPAAEDHPGGNRQADAIADSVRQAADHGDHVTADQFTAGLAALELRPIKWITGTGIAVTGAVVGLLRLLD